MNSINTDKENKELVIARLLVFPEGKKISIGSMGDFTKGELIEHVRKNDEIGKKMIIIEMKYLQSMKNIARQILANE